MGGLDARHDGFADGAAVVLTAGGPGRAAQPIRSIHHSVRGESGFAVREERGEPSVLPSGNSVVLENELLKAGEIHRQFELNTAIVKAFHRMLMLSSKA